MARRLSRRQAELLALVHGYVLRDGKIPSLRELGEQLGGMSAPAIHFGLGALARKGYVRWPPGRPHLIQVLDTEAAPGEAASSEVDVPPYPAAGPDVVSDAYPVPGMYRVPVVGKIAAGTPIEAWETPGDHVLVDTAVLRLRSGDVEQGIYALRVQGDSMVDACIRDGDLVIVRRQDTAQDGDTVVALLDGEQATLKRFYREADRVRLAPANAYYPNIYATNIRIQGKVLGVIRTC